jgi:hypothetical protein
MLRRLLSVLLAVLALVPSTGATWSIVVVNRRTGEVGVAGATCLPRVDLLRAIPMVQVGLGGGVVQASGNTNDLIPMAEGLRLGLSPDEILVLVKDAEPTPRVLQTGIVSLYPGAPVAFTGGSVGPAKFDVVGEVGDLAYAIQGNVLAGRQVILDAEATLLATPGDLGQKLLAAMQVARALGGDGRCSCSLSNPASCGTPPEEFEKSAHCGFLVVARMGDPDLPCLASGDCMPPTCHLRLNVRGRNASEGSPDPVDQLTELYAAWRASRRGQPDGLLSVVESVPSMPADGVTRRTVTIRLVDVDGVPLDHGGADVRVTPLSDHPGHLGIGPVRDLGDGRYSFTVGAGRSLGQDRLVITADTDVVHATLFPYLEIETLPPPAVHMGRSAISAAAGGAVPFVLSQPQRPGAAYLLVASASGTVPGLDLAAGVHLPLNRDGILGLTRRLAGDPLWLPGTRGVLDAHGRAEASLLAPPGALLPFVGATFSWSAVFFEDSPVLATEPVDLRIDP